MKKIALLLLTCLSFFGHAAGVEYSERSSRAMCFRCVVCSGPNGNWESPAGNICLWCFYKEYGYYPYEDMGCKW